MKTIPLFLLMLASPSFATDISVGHGPGYDFQTITGAISAAHTGDDILVAMSTYSVASGETFPLTLKNGVRLTRAAASSSPIIDATGSGKYVISGQGLQMSTEVSGFTIRGGNATGAGSHSNGGGFYLDNASILIADCIIERNRASENGGGVSCINYSSPTLYQCTIRLNEAVGFGGGGVFCDEYSAPTLRYCLITENQAGYGGGGVMCFLYSCNALITQCTITQNEAVEGAALWCDYDSAPTVSNCILWGNRGAQQIYTFFTTPRVSYCDVEGGFYGTGNFNADPQFAGANQGDFHLTASSPCIDAGDPTGGQDPDGTRIDCGALYFDQNQSGLHLAANPDPIIAGQNVILSLTNATPNRSAYLAYSLTGPGSTYVAALQITLGLNRPAQLAGPSVTNASGQVDWVLPVPPQATGLQVWLQAAQVAEASNVLASLVR